MEGEQVNTTNKILGKIDKKKAIFGGVGLLIVVLIGIAGYLFMQVQDLKDPSKKAEKELNDTIASVSALMILPPNERPTLATVSDPDKLKNEPFFTNAILGDKVLIYAQAKKAVLYSPSRKKIIEVSSFNTGNTSSTNVPLQK